MMTHSLIRLDLKHKILFSNFIQLPISQLLSPPFFLVKFIYFNSSNAIIKKLDALVKPIVCDMGPLGWTQIGRGAFNKLSQTLRDRFCNFAREYNRVNLLKIYVQNETLTEKQDLLCCQQLRACTFLEHSDLTHPPFKKFDKSHAMCGVHSSRQYFNRKSAMIATSQLMERKHLQFAFYNL